MRIRSVKPEFWSHPVTGRLPGDVQAFLVSLLNLADDHGYFFADPVSVRSALRPFDETSENTRRLLAEASKIGWVEVRKHPTHGPVGRVMTFDDHQRVDKPRDSTIEKYWAVAFVESSPTVLGIVQEASCLEGKGREGKGAGSRDAVANAPAEAHPLQVAWNEHRAPTMPEWRETSADRRKKANARLKERQAAEWVEVVKRLAASDFASGRTGKWTATVDWLLEKPGNAAKVLEGNYDNRAGPRDNRAPVAAETVDWTTAAVGEIAL